MLFLFLRILFTVSFAHLLRLSQARTPRPMGAAAVNYLVAAALCAAWTRLSGSDWHTPAAALGALAGVTYVSSLVLMLPAMRRCGVSITGAVVQLSMMAPVATAAWRFGEYPNFAQGIGILLTLVALPVLSTASAVGAAAPPGRPGPLAALLFASTSASQVLMKEFSATCPPSALSLYSSCLFAAATLATYAWMLLTGDTGRADAAAPLKGTVIPEWPIGALLGLINVLQLVFLLLALRALPAVIVFPVSASLGIMVNTGMSMALWRERPAPAAWTGIVLAAVAVILLNLR